MNSIAIALLVRLGKAFFAYCCSSLVCYPTLAPRAAAFTRPLQLAGDVIRSKISTRAQHSWLATSPAKRCAAAAPAPEHAAPPPAAQL